MVVHSRRAYPQTPVPICAVISFVGWYYLYNGENYSQPPRTWSVHNEGDNICFVDGHAKCTSPAATATSATRVTPRHPGSDGTCRTRKPQSVRYDETWLDQEGSLMTRVTALCLLFVMVAMVVITAGVALAQPAGQGGSPTAALQPALPPVHQGLREWPTPRTSSRAKSPRRWTRAVAAPPRTIWIVAAVVVVVAGVAYGISRKKS